MEAKCHFAHGKDELRSMGDVIKLKIKTKNIWFFIFKWVLFYLFLNWAKFFRPIFIEEDLISV